VGEVEGVVVAIMVVGGVEGMVVAIMVVAAVVGVGVVEKRMRKRSSFARKERRSQRVASARKRNRSQRKRRSQRYATILKRNRVTTGARTCHPLENMQTRMTTPSLRWGGCLRQWLLLDWRQQ